MKDKVQRAAREVASHLLPHSVAEGGGPLIIVMNRIPVAAGREKEFEETFMRRDRAVDQVPGFIDMQVLRPAEGNTYVVLTRWNSREAFEKWTQSEAFLAAHRKQSPGLSESRPVLEIYEVFAQ